MNRSSATAAGSICDCGIWLAVNGTPVTGSINCLEIDEKSPARIAAVGTVAY